MTDPQKQHDKDLKQIKSLVGELRKAKLKCLELSEHLNEELPNLQYYEILEVRCKRQVDKLDKQGLNMLLNELIKSLADLYEVERDYMYEAEKNSFKKIAPPPPARRQRQYLTKQELGPFKVPIYYSRSEQGPHKIERISNYIQAIGNSMDSLRKSMQPQGEWSPKDFLTYQPEYLTLKQKIQMYKMRNEELVTILERRVAEQVEKMVQNGQKVEEGEDYVVMKVSKQTVDNYGKIEPEPPRASKRNQLLDVDQQYHPHSMIEPKKRSKSRRTNLQKINEEENANDYNNEKPTETDQTAQMDLHITSFQKSQRPNHSRISKFDQSQGDIDQNGNFVYMVRKVSPESQLNSSIISSISSLRSLRKKVFDDDIWDQFQKL